MMGCGKIAALVDRRAAGLSQAERLQLEDHLSECARCHRDAQLLAGLADLIEQASVELSPASRERTIERALRAAPPPAKSPSRSSWRFAIVAGAAAALVLTIGIWRLRPHALAGDRLLSGELAAAQRALRPGDALPPGVSLAARADSTVAVAHGRVTFAAGTVVSWRPQDATLRLEQGAVDVSVDPAPHRPFRVSTPRFAVEVLGTEFHVEVDQVRVTRGLVRVVAPEGGILLASLGAGESFTHPGIIPGSPLPTPPPPEPSTMPPRRHASAARFLILAREHIAAHDLERADREIDRALAAHPTRDQLAEAQTLRAERAQVSGDLEGAARLYLETAVRFRDLQAGELALFAAARLEVKAKRNDRAVKLLQEYLRRYPSGRFRAEAQTRLQSLETP